MTLSLGATIVLGTLWTVALLVSHELKLPPPEADWSSRLHLPRKAKQENAQRSGNKRHDNKD